MPCADAYIAYSDSILFVADGALPIPIPYSLKPLAFSALIMSNGITIDGITTDADALTVLPDFAWMVTV